jgi:hypothetical protein
MLIRLYSKLVPAPAVAGGGPLIGTQAAWRDYRRDEYGFDTLVQQGYLINPNAVAMALAVPALRSLGLATTWHDRGSRAGQLFLGFALVLGGCFAGFTMAHGGPEADTALYWLRLAYLAMPALLFLFPQDDRGIAGSGARTAPDPRRPGPEGAGAVPPGGNAKYAMSGGGAMAMAKGASWWARAIPWRARPRTPGPRPWRHGSE